MKKIFVGIDPGLHGAIAFIYPDGTTIEVFDTPITQIVKNRRNRNVYEPARLWSLLDTQRQVHQLSVALEDVQPMPTFGASNFSFGAGVAYWEMALVGHKIPYEMVRPQVWKKEIGIPARSDKNKSRLVAARLYPQYRELFERVKDDGRADALLIAHWLKSKSRVIAPRRRKKRRRE